MSDIFLLPDVQAKSGVDFEHLTAAGNYIVRNRPDTVVCIGDFWDMESLSSYDRGKLQFEGRRYIKDVDVGNYAMGLLLAPLKRLQRVQKKNKKKPYSPRMVFTCGNHESRINRAVEENSQLEGLLSYDHLHLGDWEVYPFLTPVVIDGVTFCHFMPNPMTGKPYGGMVDTRLKNVGYSFVMGHQQQFQYGRRDLTNGQVISGLVMGAFYSHDEEYKGHQGNKHFRGVAHLRNVCEGDYDLESIRLDTLVEDYGDG